MEEHATGACSLRPGRPDIVLTNRLLHVGFDKATVVGEAHVGLAGDRQDRMPSDVDSPRGKACVGRQIAHAEERQLPTRAPQPDGKNDLQEEGRYERGE